MACTILTIVNYGIVLLYGVFLSAELTGEIKSKKDTYLTVAIAIVLLAVQGIFYSTLGVDVTEKWYPFITHIPLILALTFIMKRPFSISTVSVFTAYLCCQIPHWFSTTILSLTKSDLVSEISYTVIAIVSFVLLERYLVRPANEAMNYSKTVLAWLGSLPILYYIFDYVTTVYTHLLYSAILPFNEFITTMTALFYITFVAMYHRALENRYSAELENTHLTMELKQSDAELTMLQRSIEETATYRHDMRHHFIILGEYIFNGETEKALEYIHETQKDLDRLTPTRYCRNKSVNLIISYFASRAEQLEVDFAANVSLPEELMLSETELCTLLSNGLENALNAVSQCKGDRRWVHLDFKTHKSSLLISIENPYLGEVVMENGLPVTAEKGHGFGVKSISSIAERHNGIYTFDANNGIFTMRVILKQAS